MTQYRTVEIKKENGSSYFKIQSKFLGLWWNEGGQYGMVIYQTLDEAKEHLELYRSSINNGKTIEKIIHN